MLFTFIMGATSYGQHINASHLDSLFNLLERHQLAMGSIAISHNGTLKYQRSIGYVSIGSNKLKTNNDTKYRIGSVSKVFTAVMVFQLIEEGKLSLEQTIDKYFDSLPNAGSITISHLLGHSSGLHNYTEGTDFPNWMNLAKAHNELLKIVADKGADFEPGKKAAYSNTNYLLLSYIIEKIEGISYADALRQRLITKLNLKNTYYGKQIDVHKNEAASYRFTNNTWNKEKETNMEIHSGAGSIVSTPADLTRFMDELFNYKIISKASLKKMTTFNGEYGMGLFLFHFHDMMGYGHSGKIEQFSSSVRHYPDSKLTIAYCMNAQVYSRDDILHTVLSICFNKPFSIPQIPYPLKTKDELDSYVGVYVSTEPAITIKCTRRNDTLLVETMGQVMAFEPIDEKQFFNAQFGFFLNFSPAKGEVVIKETDNIYYLKKQPPPAH